MVSTDELWIKLWENKIYRLINKESFIGADNEDVFGEVINSRTGEFLFFIMTINMPLKLYPIVDSIEYEEGFINLEYIYYCNLILIGLISALESYLVRSFWKIAQKVNVKELDMEDFINFVKEFNLKNQYLDALTIHNNHDFILADLIPSRLDFQQKEKLKIAYQLLGIYLPNIVDKQQVVWNEIFEKDNGYLPLRHGAVHGGLTDLIIKEINGKKIINEKILVDASLSISKFVYELDKSITDKFSKTDYPEFYSQKAE